MRNKKIKIVAYSIFVYICLSSLASLYLYTDYQNKKSIAIEEIKNESIRQLTYTHNEYKELSIRIKNTLDLLSNSRSLYDYFLSPSIRVDQAVEYSWLRVVLAEKFFSKLELIDSEGVRQLSFTHNENDIDAIKVSKVQSVINEKYLATLSEISAGSIFSEGLILNSDLESTGIYESIMKLAIPIDLLGSRKGYVLAELGDTNIIKAIQFSSTLSILPSMLNQDGYYLITDDQSQAFGHLVNGRMNETLKIKKPELWNYMSTEKVGGTYIDGDIYSFYQFSITTNTPDKKAYFLLHYPKKELDKIFNSIQFEQFEDAALLFLLLSLIVIPFGILLVLWDKSNLESQLAKSALEGMSAVVITDKYQRIIKVNSAFTSISGFSGAEAIGKSTFDVLNSDNKQFQKRLANWQQVNDLGAWQGEIEVLSKSGKALSLLVRIQAVKKKAKEAEYYIISYIDISKRNALEKELRYLSEKDSLSDCWNRRKFELELENQTLLTNRYHPTHQCCLAILDIDWFKRINDTKGHDIGDRVIRLIADVLKKGSRDTDFVARIGGEEFAIIMPHTELKDAEMAINRLRVMVSQLKEYQVTISGGLTDIGISKERAYKCADMALYESKASGRNTISICTNLEDLA